MTKTAKTWMIFFALLTVLLPLAMSEAIESKQAQSVPIWSVSVNKQLLQADQRVAAFRVNITSGTIASLPKIPVGWAISLSNDENWTPTMTASARVGAAAFDLNSIREGFHDFLRIKKLKMPAQFETPAFDIQIDLGVTTDFEKINWIRVPVKDLSISKLK